MARAWHIKGWEGGRTVFAQFVPGHLSEQEVSVILQRLACRQLSETEIVRSSLRRNDPDYAPLLERVGHGMPITYGQGIYYTAELSEAAQGA